MLMETQMSGFPVAELLSGGAGAIAVAMCWMFLKYLRDQRTAELEESRRKDELVGRVTSDFSETVKAVGSDVKDGLNKMHETQTALLADHREQVAQLHSMLRGVADR